MVVMNNAHRLSSSAKRLKRFVSEGGGLIVFAGDWVEASDYNQISAQLRGNPPAELGDLLARPKSWTMKPPSLTTSSPTTAHTEMPLHARHETVRPLRRKQRVLITSQSGNPSCSVVQQGRAAPFHNPASKRWNNPRPHYNPSSTDDNAHQ